MPKHNNRGQVASAAHNRSPEKESKQNNEVQRDRLLEQILDGKYSIFDT